MAKERTPRRSPWEPPPSAVLKKRTAEKQSSAKLPHLGRISARPRWVSRARSFAFSFLFKLSSITGREAGAKAFSRKQRPCNFHVCKFFELANAKAEVVCFCAVLRAGAPATAHCGNPKGIRPFGSFSFAISLWNDKEMASNHRGALCRGEQKGKVVERLAKQTPSPRDESCGLGSSYSNASATAFKCSTMGNC